MTPYERTERVLELVRDERRRQDGLRDAGRFAYTCADKGLSLGEKLAVLTEEVGEVAREVLSYEALVVDGSGTKDQLREELVQVAAIAVAWAEALEPTRVIAEALTASGELDPPVLRVPK